MATLRATAQCSRTVDAGPRRAAPRRSWGVSAGLKFALVVGAVALFAAGKLFLGSVALALVVVAAVFKASGEIDRVLDAQDVANSDDAVFGGSTSVRLTRGD